MEAATTASEGGRTRSIYESFEPNNTHEQISTVDDRTDDADYFNEVVTAIDVRNNNTVGCCSYVAREEKLFVSSDMKYGGIEIVDACTFPDTDTNALLYWRNSQDLLKSHDDTPPVKN